ncbi:Uncharacterized protein TCAP_00984 [Tolypocladium capitatum]|uniref:DUF7600 domain-containing protein n=1 Tax=Tolypocladium capitatum TaxID=45235 RepID=A0A2K3QNK9_9HYPO|nr:Uncharacterized protein TCAP_00984 [Tolypocladium capitatum]
MSPTLFSCALCGWVIGDSNEPGSWANQFRGIYSSPGGIVLTGVGNYDDPRGGTGVGRQPAFNDQYGFIFHDACWSLLKRTYGSNPIPVERLFRVCSSLPIPAEGTNLGWGHDYGRLLIMDNEARFPWESPATNESADVALFATNNPYIVGDIQRLLSEEPQTPPGTTPVCSATTTRDCFSRLPLELCIAIAGKLPTADTMNARLVSRAFWPVFDSQHFWASKFRDNGGRSWLFEAHDGQLLSDWRSLYHVTKPSRLSPALQNRARVWNLAMGIHPMLDLRRETSSTVFSPMPKSENVVWSDAAAAIAKPSRLTTCDWFEEGCLALHKEGTGIPDRLFQLTVSFVYVGNVQYISGLRVIASSGKHAQLGYESGTFEHIRALSDFQGFNLAVGPRGLRAIQVYRGHEQSRWYGTPDDCPKTIRLAAVGPVAGLEAAFDECKLVSLAVSEQSPPSIVGLKERSPSLRRSGYWFPDVPGPKLNLNEDAFPQRDYHMSGYHPLFWTLFGGSAGARLRNLQTISVTVAGYVQGIKFQYSQDGLPEQSCAFGRHRYDRTPGYSKVINFSIDGPGGEVIDALEVCLEYSDSSTVYEFARHGALYCFKVFTNRGRSCLFCHGEPRPSLVTKRLMGAPGTTITGIYGSQDAASGCGITALGVISEKIYVA